MSFLVHAISNTHTTQRMSRPCPTNPYKIQRIGVVSCVSLTFQMFDKMMGKMLTRLKTPCILTHTALNHTHAQEHTAHTPAHHNHHIALHYTPQLFIPHNTRCHSAHSQYTKNTLLLDCVHYVDKLRNHNHHIIMTITASLLPLHLHMLPLTKSLRGSSTNKTLPTVERRWFNF